MLLLTIVRYAHAARTGILMLEAPSPWVMKFAPLIRPGGSVLDLACGNGRHAIWLAGQGYAVDAIDRNAEALAPMAGMQNINISIADLETADGYEFAHSYDGIIVSRYLHRPLLKTLAGILNPGGVLVYETFMLGNERYGKPSNPDFLLEPDELQNLYSPLLKIVAFEQGEVSLPRPAVMQRICAVKGPVAAS